MLLCGAAKAFGTRRTQPAAAAAVERRRKSRRVFCVVIVALMLPVLFFCWMSGGELRAAGRGRRLELHVLDARQVGVEEVELHLAVAACLRDSAIRAFTVVACERGDGVGHVLDAERKVI